MIQEFVQLEIPHTIIMLYTHSYQMIILRVIRAQEPSFSVYGIRGLERWKTKHLNYKTWSK